MGAGFRRVMRRVLFGTGVLLIGIALAAMIANQFRVVYLSQSGTSAERRLYLERGVVRYVSMSGSTQVAQPRFINVNPIPVTGDAVSIPQTPWTPPASAAQWKAIAVPRFSRRDAAFAPYEWLPRYTDDGSAVSASVPWWMVGALGGGLMCAGFWGIRAPRGHCRTCEYDLRGLPAGASVCPECGAKLPVASAPSAPPPCASSTSAHA